ncbi:ATP synthase F1 subunit delta [Chloroflexota bacterium]
MSTKAQPKDYARAVYELALETWTQQLGEVQKALKSDADLRARMGDGSLSVSEKLSSLDAVVRGGLAEAVRRFLGTLLEADQLGELDMILVELDRLVSTQPDRRQALVTSAVPLTSDEKEALRAMVIERFGPDLDFQFKVDAAVLGGIHLRVGDQVIDGTVAGKLAGLRDRLAA